MPADVIEARGAGDLDQDISEVSVFRCDGFERLDDPPTLHRSPPEGDIFELGRFGEVDGAWWGYNQSSSGGTGEGVRFVSHAISRCSTVSEHAATNCPTQIGSSPPHHSLSLRG